jgi:hypothetical protein
MTFETTAYSTLVIVALGLLVTVTGGVAYLTALEWRDRRREQRDRKGR